MFYTKVALIEFDGQDRQYLDPSSSADDGRSTKKAWHRDDEKMEKIVKKTMHLVLKDSGLGSG